MTYFKYILLISVIIFLGGVDIAHQCFRFIEAQQKLVKLEKELANQQHVNKKENVVFINKEKIIDSFLSVIYSSGLTLNSASLLKEDMTHVVKWDLIFSGDFFQLNQFLINLSRAYFPVDVQYVEIKSENNRLKIILRIVSYSVFVRTWQQDFKINPLYKNDLFIEPKFLTSGNIALENKKEKIAIIMLPNGEPLLTKD